MKKRTKSHNLINRVNEMQFLDADPTSKDYFRVTLPERFGVGKNKISIQPTPNLLKGSPIKIDIYDDKNNLIYYEVTNIIDVDNSRIIAVYIYPNNQYGNINIYIAGTSDKFQNTLSENVLWRKSVPFSDIEVDERPLYSDFPKVTITEKIQPLYTQVEPRITSKKSNNNKITLVKTESPRIGKTDNPIVRLTDKTINGISQISAPSSVVSAELNITSSATVVSGDAWFVNRLNYDTITVTSSFFSSSMVGGQIYINVKDELSKRQPEFDIEPGAIEKYNIVYSASIVEVVNESTIKTWPNFVLPVNGYYLTNFTDITNFTCSWYGDATLTTKTSTKHINQSYLTFEFEGIDPVVGNCNRVGIDYKQYYTRGEFSTLSDIPVTPTEFLCDFNFPESNGTFKRLGYPKTVADVTSYWTVSRSAGVSSSGFPGRNESAIAGVIEPTYSKIINPTDWVKLTTTSSYDFVASNHTTYVVSFNYEAIKNSDVFKIPQVDVYISGSSVTNNNNIKPIQPPLIIENIGAYIGSVTAYGRFGRFNEHFISNSKNEKVKLNIIIRSGTWKFSEISIKPNRLNPNHFYAIVPTPDGVNYSELEFNIKYKNNTKESNIITNLKGLMVSGSSKDL